MNTKTNTFAAIGYAGIMGTFISAHLAKIEEPKDLTTIIQQQKVIITSIQGLEHETRQQPTTLYTHERIKQPLQQYQESRETRKKLLELYQQELKTLEANPALQTYQQEQREANHNALPGGIGSLLVAITAVGIGLYYTHKEKHHE